MAQEPVFTHRAPQRALSGDADLRRVQEPIVDAQAPEVALPGDLVGKRALPLRGQRLNDSTRQSQGSPHCVWRIDGQNDSGGWCEIYGKTPEGAPDV
jgi:hypothetical protein